MLTNKAETQDAALITTEKDFARLTDQQRTLVKTLPITLEIENCELLYTLLMDKLS